MSGIRRRLRSGSVDAVGAGTIGEGETKIGVTTIHEENQAKAGTPETQSSVASPSIKYANGRKRREGYCVCKGEDDGRPMVRCEGACRNWYHFGCVNLSEDTAGELDRYFCPSCATDSGIRPIMDYEGSMAFAQTKDSRSEIIKSGRRRLLKLKGARSVTSSEESVDEDSEDEYVDESAKHRKATGKRVSRRLSSSEESDEDVDSENIHKPNAAKRQKKTTQTRPSISQKHPSTAQLASSSKNRVAGSASDEALRQYSLEKLEGIMKAIFEEHGVYEQRATDEGAQGPDPEQPSPTAEEQAKDYARELEHCMMEKYSELDAKTGKLTAQNKYKERLRMFQFNLPKPDRALLRRGIALGRISPAQLSVMSSKDLADEQRKHDIEQAERDALEHSILQKITAPSAKITHKGFEAIEDVSGQRAADSREEEERMEREKRERERQARMKKESVKQEGSSFTPVEPSPLSASFPESNSPLPAQTAPASSVLIPSPSVTIGPSFIRSPIKPLFVPTLPPAPFDVSDTGEGGLRLSDLIDFDSAAVRGEAVTADQVATVATVTDAGASDSPSIVTPTALLSLASAQSSAQAPNFDLGSFWKTDTTDAELQFTHSAGLEAVRPKEDEEDEGEAMDIDEEGSDDNHDEALDAILAQTKTISPLDSNNDRPELQTLPTVWTGHIAMPTEKLDLLEFKVLTKQIGGQVIEPTSNLWRVLFPSPQTRVDGRVPTGSSNPYLVTSRLNPSKELVITAFLPESEESREKFDEFFDFFVKKDRHALVFPWGQHTKSGAPGRELYIIPLAKDQPIPEFVELMDNHHLPNSRAENVLLGVFVLNKGKLAAAAKPSFPANTSFPPTLPGMAIPSGSPSYTQGTQVKPGAVPPPVKIDQTALAAEVASLTPEQISLMLRHLQHTAPQLASAIPSSMPFPVSSAPPAQTTAWNTAGSQHPPNASPPQAAQTGFLPYGQQYHTAQPFPEPRTNGPFPSALPPDNVNDGYDRPQKHFGRDERERRGRGRPRGSGRGRGRNHVEDAPPADNGWSGRGRGRY